MLTLLPLVILKASIRFFTPTLKTTDTSFVSKQNVLHAARKEAVEKPSRITAHSVSEDATLPCLLKTT